MDAANAVPVIGTPLAYGLALVALLVVAFAGPWGQVLLTLAHEGGHYAVALVTGYRPKAMTIDEHANGLTEYHNPQWNPLRLIRRAAGYATPPLLGLGGAKLIAHGQAWSALMIALVLLVASFLIATNQIAIVMAGLAVLGVGAAVLVGGPTVRAAVAVGLTWLMLIGGAENAITIPRSAQTDLDGLRCDSLIVPKLVWKAGFVILAVVCLWKGGRALLLI